LLEFRAEMIPISLKNLNPSFLWQPGPYMAYTFWRDHQYFKQNCMSHIKPETCALP
jgi:hypothetical protein